MQSLEGWACMRCKFSLLDIGRDKEPIRVCRRRAPSIVVIPTPQGIVVQNMWPQTRGEDWCGDFEAKLAIAN